MDVSELGFQDHSPLGHWLQAIFLRKNLTRAEYARFFDSAGPDQGGDRVFVYLLDRNRDPFYFSPVCANFLDAETGLAAVLGLNN